MSTRARADRRERRSVMKKKGPRKDPKKARAGRIGIVAMEASLSPEQRELRRLARGRANRRRARDTEWRAENALRNRKRAEDPTWLKTMSEAAKERSEGLDWQEANIKAARKTQSIVRTCPHCGKVGHGNVMKRWHFDKCQQAPEPPMRMTKKELAMAEAKATAFWTGYLKSQLTTKKLKVKG